MPVTPNGERSEPEGSGRAGGKVRARAPRPLPDSSTSLRSVFGMTGSLLSSRRVNEVSPRWDEKANLAQYRMVCSEASSELRK